jgi:transcriptional regulator with GAF, ATPase, and Fis domain
MAGNPNSFADPRICMTLPNVARFERRAPRPVAEDPLTVDLISQAELAATSDAKVLLTGESGVGKDVFARYVHANSARSSAEYVAINCAGVAESLLESELFGHLKGSFTGAYRDKPGKLQLAHRGTLFLDELGEMSLRMQALLLRFLENGEIQAVGSDRTQCIVDVRVIAATNRNLSELVAAGRFREDLLYRLRVIHLHVPPLRERPADIRSLGSYFLSKNGRQHTLSPEAWRVLNQYRWPGNVRELQNVIEQVTCLAASDGPIGVDQLPQIVRSAPSLTPAHERRRQLADELYQAIVTGGYSFWDHIYPHFLDRDITRHDMRELLRRGLSTTRGNYRSLLPLFRIPKSDYKRFLNFLAAHDCGVDYREFRNGQPATRPRVIASVPLREKGRTARKTASASRSSAAD